MGALPPMSDAEWNKAFDAYKHIGQYKYVNSGFTLHDFKFIFFWEWTHRNWARLLSVVFAVGFAFFLIRGYLSKAMVKPFIILFVLGALQGVVGILMVLSGVNTEDIHVNYMWLAAHFISAMVLACYTLWFALKLLIPEEKRTSDKGIHNFTLALIAVLFVQLMYGGFMAGLKAAAAAPTWPLINGSFFPPGLAQHGWLKDPDLSFLILNVHFVHRTLAYILFGLVIWWYFYTRRHTASFGSNQLITKTSVWPVALVCLQVVLGIVTVISAPQIVYGKFGIFESLAELHQLVAMFLLMSLVVNLYVVRRK